MYIAKTNSVKSTQHACAARIFFDDYMYFNDGWMIAEGDEPFVLNAGCDEEENMMCEFSASAALIRFFQKKSGRMTDALLHAPYAQFFSTAREILTVKDKDIEEIRSIFTERFEHCCSDRFFQGERISHRFSVNEKRTYSDSTPHIPELEPNLLHTVSRYIACDIPDSLVFVNYDPKTDVITIEYSSTTVTLHSDEAAYDKLRKVRAFINNKR